MKEHERMGVKLEMMDERAVEVFLDIGPPNRKCAKLNSKKSRKVHLEYH